MTREEAIRILRAYIWKGELDEARNMAIKALEQEPTKNDLGVDCISREDALMCLTGEFENREYELSELIKIFSKRIKALPSVTPQEPQAFKWCTDCREYDQEKHCCHRYSKVIRDTVEEIRQEPKTGHWIGIDEEPHEDYECDKCGYIISTYTANIEPHTEYKYCPNCGCRMIEPQESEEV